VKYGIIYLGDEKMKRQQFSEAQMEEIKAARKANQNKKIEKRLQVLEMHGEGKKQREIKEATGFSMSYINSVLKKYREEGLKAVGESHYVGNHRNMTVEEEAALLAPFEKEMKAGKMIEVSRIKKAYMEKVGHSIGTGQIYYVLKRHGIRKIMPRSEHPNKASEEAIEASKKLTQQ